MPNELGRRLNDNQKHVRALLTPYLASRSVKTRSLALLLLCNFGDRQDYVAPLVEDLDDGGSWRMNNIQAIKWDASNESLKPLAREKLRRNLEGEWAPRSIGLLAFLGNKDDIPALRKVLERVLAREYPLDDPAGTSLQAEREHDPEEIAPYEKMELDVRDAMATLGDNEQYEFFRGLLMGKNYARAYEALRRFGRFWRPELVPAVIPFLDDQRTGRGFEPGWWLACQLLARSNPSVAAQMPKNVESLEILRLWKLWAAEYLAKGGAGPAAPQPPKSPESAPSPNPSAVEPGAAKRVDPHPPAQGTPRPASEAPSGPSVWFVLAGVLGACAAAGLIIATLFRRLRPR